MVAHGGALVALIRSPLSVETRVYGRRRESTKVNQTTRRNAMCVRRLATARKQNASPTNSTTRCARRNDCTTRAEATSGTQRHSGIAKPQLFVRRSGAFRGAVGSSF